MKNQVTLLSIVTICFAGQIYCQQAFYPLAIGTKWRWSLYWGTSSYTVEITRDTLMPNGHRYSIIPGFYSIPERWERQEGSCVYRCDQGSGQEWLLFDFSKSSGDIINASQNVVLAGTWTDTLFGSRRRIWSFSVGGVPGGIDAAAGAGYTIADSIGLFDYTDWNSALRVVGATIGSRHYGLSSIPSIQSHSIPSEIQLDQNYPNPFNGNATITFVLPRETNVKLNIFDISGKLVTQLINNRLGIGKHRFVWDASQFSSGVYYCRLSTTSETKTIKLLYLK